MKIIYEDFNEDKELLDEGGLSRVWQHTLDTDTFAVIGSRDKDTKKNALR